jgi:Ca2+-binding RTX toxin-like protein
MSVDRVELPSYNLLSQQSNFSWSGDEQSNPGFVGEFVSAAHFGSGFEFHRHEVSEGSDFTLASEQVGLSFLRYPGGTQTENYFDLANPDNPEPVALVNNAGSSTDVTPLSDFLSYAAEHGISTVIVLPTWRFFDQVTRRIDPQAEEIIKTFVMEVLSGAYGDANIQAFEIGNEWFNSAYSWTPAEFASLQRSIAVWVDEARSDTDNTPSIWIQSSQQGARDFDANGVSDNVEFLQAFSDEDLRSVDGLVDHFYQPTRSEGVLDDQYLDNPWVAATRSDRLREDGWVVDGPNALDIVTTEWNIRADRPGNITGLERGPMLLRLFTDMLQAGVDVAMIWTTQALGSGSGSLFEQGQNGMTPTGLLFQMMMNTLQGSRLMDPNGDGELSIDEMTFSTTSVDNAGYIYSFASDGKVIVYIASGVDEEIEINADFSAFADSGYHLHGTLLGVRSGDDPLAVDADAQINALSAMVLEGAQHGDGVLNFDLNPYEVIQLEFSWDEGQVLRGDWYNPIDDELLGTSGGDQIFGYGGDDNLRGFSGDDVIDGGVGRDDIRGGNGEDLIFAGRGRDTVAGGNGSDEVHLGIGTDLYKGGSSGASNDRVYGNSGNDQIFSGSGNDELFGGQGRDTLAGGAGDDLLEGGLGFDTFRFRTDVNTGNDIIVDFTPGKDTLQIMGLTWDDLSLSGSERGTTATWETGQVEIVGISTYDLSQDDFLFL